MPIQTDTINRSLYDLLTVRYDDVTPLDSEEKTTAPEEADIFRFTFEKDGESYGKVYVTIDNSRNLVLYYGDEVEDSPDTNTSGTEFTDSWSGFRNMLKQWSQRKQLDFELKNKNHLAKDMAQRSYYKNKENLGESYYPMGKRGSYSDAVPNVKIIIQHTRQIGEGEQRYRNIDKIFVENTMGERFAVPSNKPGIAKVYARHIAEGGSPYDDRGRHITSLVEEYTKMAGFVRATKNKQFNESTNMLIQEGINHYQSLRETLSRMIGHRGYNAYFEAWQPILSEEITEETNLNELFVQETIDPRIESVMPILSKLYKKVSEMKEINQLEEWADSIINEYKQGDDTDYIRLLKSKLESDKPLTSQEKEILRAYLAAKKLGLKEGDGGQTSSNPMGIPESELDEGKGAIRKFLAGLGIVGALGAYISSEDEAILQKMAVKYDQAETPQERAQIKHDIERVTKGSLVKEEDIEESGLQAYLGNKKYGKEGMDALRKAGREHVGKEKMAAIRAKYDKLDEEDMAEDLDANQKRVGQLGPYEKVGPQGAVGKLVGGESIREGQEDLDTIKRLLGEGVAGEFAGGTLGGVGGALAGSALGALAGGPTGAALGGVLGGAAGGTAGQMMGRDSADDNKLSEDQLNEFAFLAPALAAGARALLPLLSRAGPALGRMASTAGRAGAEVAGKAATGVGKGAVELGKSAVQSTAQNAGKVGLGAGIYSIADEIGKSIPQGLNKVYTDATQATSALTSILGNALDGKTIGELGMAAAKYAIPLGILLAALYGGKKIIDQVMSEGEDDSIMGSIGKTFEGQEDLDTIKRLLGK